MLYLHNKEAVAHLQPVLEAWMPGGSGNRRCHTMQVGWREARGANI